MFQLCKEGADGGMDGDGLVAGDFGRLARQFSEPLVKVLVASPKLLVDNFLAQLPVRRQLVPALVVQGIRVEFDVFGTVARARAHILHEGGVSALDLLLSVEAEALQCALGLGRTGLSRDFLDFFEDERDGDGDGPADDSPDEEGDEARGTIRGWMSAALEDLLSELKSTID